MKRVALTCGALAAFAVGCSSGSERPDFGAQSFESDASERVDGGSFFDDASDASRSEGDAGAVLDGGASADVAEGSAGCQPDPAEPDNTAATATSLGQFSDSKKTTQELTIHTLHDAQDEDWFLLEVADSLDFSNPEPEVTVSGLSDADTVEVAAWYTCDDGNGAECAEGDPDDTFGPGCAASGSGEEGVFMELKAQCDGTSEDGTLLVRIRSLHHSGSCAPYIVRFRVD